MNCIFDCILNIPFGDLEDVGGIGAGVVVAGANGVVLFSPQVALGGSPYIFGNIYDLAIIILLFKRLIFSPLYTNRRTSLQTSRLIHMGHYKLATCCYTQ